jgi:signal transduction histidine kinase
MARIETGPAVTEPGVPAPGQAPAPRRAPGYPFRGPGWAPRVLPFAVLAVAAEASLALPPGSPSVIPTVISLLLLIGAGASFALPWAALPRWAPVLVPLTYTGSVLALTLAAGTTSGVAIVALMPVVWTALFHRRWESGAVLAAVVIVVTVFSLEPVMDPAAVVTRRVLFWGGVGALITVATHGLRGRIRRAQSEQARLQERLHEVSLLADRERIAGDLQERVIQRIFAASLSLQAAQSLSRDAELGRRIEGATADLDEATRLVRQSIFGLRGRPEHGSLRRDVLDLCGEFATRLGGPPSVSFSGSIDTELPGRTADQLIRALRETLALVGEQPEPVLIAVAAADDAWLTVTLPGPWPPERPGLADAPRTLRDIARQLGAVIAIGVESEGGTRLAWQIPLGPGGS